MDVYGYVYLIRNKVNGKVYVGQTVGSLRTRWQGHVQMSREKNPNMLVCKAIAKYGPESFDMVELHRAYSREELDEMEIQSIFRHESLDRSVGYNVRDGGSRGTWSADMRADMSAKKKLFCAENPHVAIAIGLKQRGKKHSEQAKRLMSESRKGVPKPHTVEQRKAIEDAWHNDPTFTARKSASAKASYTPELIELRRQSQLAYWNSPSKLEERTQKKEEKQRKRQEFLLSKDLVAIEAARRRAISDKLTNVPRKTPLGAWGFRGVHKPKDREQFQACIKYNGKKLYIGSYSTALEAAEAYNQKAIELFGPLAVLNDLHDLATETAEHQALVRGERNE